MRRRTPRAAVRAGETGHDLRLRARVGPRPPVCAGRTDRRNRQRPTKLGLPRAVLEEGRDADAGVLGREHLGEQLLLELDAGRERPSRPSSIARLARPWATTGARGQLGGQREGPVVRASSGHHLVDQADAQRLLRADLPAGEDHAPWPGPGRRGGPAAGCPPPPGMIPSRISGCPNLARSRRDAQVAGQGQLAPAAEGEAGRPPRSRSGGWRPRRRAPRTNAPPTTRASSGPPNSVMSAPAANSRSPPVTTTAPGGSSVSAGRRGLQLAEEGLRDRALTLGLSRRTTATPSSRRSTCTSGVLLRTWRQDPTPLPGPPLGSGAEQLVGGGPRVELARGHRVGQLRRPVARRDRPGPAPAAAPPTSRVTSSDAAGAGARPARRWRSRWVRWSAPPPTRSATPAPDGGGGAHDRRPPPPPDGASPRTPAEGDVQHALEVAGGLLGARAGRPC